MVRVQKLGEPFGFGTRAVLALTSEYY